MVIYTKKLDLNRRIYILIKNENVFTEYMEVLEKVRSIIKTLIVNLYIRKISKT